MKFFLCIFLGLQCLGSVLFCWKTFAKFPRQLPRQLPKVAGQVQYLGNFLCGYCECAMPANPPLSLRTYIPVPGGWGRGPPCCKAGKSAKL